MTLAEFKLVIKEKKDPDNLNPYLKAMFEDALGNWDNAHMVAQDIHDSLGSLIHAYLHRKEGDRWNANYWYSQAGRQMPKTSLDEEWEAICEEIFMR